MASRFGFSQDGSYVPINNATPVNINVPDAPQDGNSAVNQDYVTSALAGENTWDRIGTSLVPHVQTDTVIVGNVNQNLFDETNGNPGYIDVPVFGSGGGGSSISMTLNGNTRVQFIVNGVPFVYTFPANTVATPDMNTLSVMWFQYADYNGGSPVIRSTKVVTDINYTTKIALANSYIEGSFTSQNTYTSKALDTYKPVMKMMQNDIRFNFLSHISGGVPSASVGSNFLSFSEHFLHFGPSQYDIPSVTAGIDPFEWFYHDGTGWHESSATTWQSASYNNYSTGIVGMTANRYAYYDIYMAIKSPTTATYKLVLSQAEFTSLGAASADPRISQLPPIITAYTFGIIYVGRLIYQRNATSAAQINSAYVSSTSNAIVTQHSSLGGLSSDDHLQYLLKAGRTLTHEPIYLNNNQYNVDTSLVAGNGGIIKKGSNSTFFNNLITGQIWNSAYSMIDMTINDSDIPEIHFNSTSGAVGTWNRMYSVTGHTAFTMQHYGAGKIFYFTFGANQHPTAGDAYTTVVYPMQFKYDAGRAAFITQMPTTYPITVSSNTRALYIDDSGTIGYLSSCREQKEIVPDLDYESMVYTIPVKSYIKKLKTTDENGLTVWVNNTDPLTRYVETGAIAEELEELDYDLFQHIIQYEDTANPIGVGSNVNGVPVMRSKVNSTWKPCGINYPQLIAPLVYVCQQQKKKIDQDGLRITTLESQVATLTSRLNDLVTRFDLDVASH